MHVLQYLGRYTHRVGISNSRLINVTADAVTFRTRWAETTTNAGRILEAICAARAARWLSQDPSRGSERVGVKAPSRSKCAATNNPGTDISMSGNVMAGFGDGADKATGAMPWDPRDFYEYELDSPEYARAAVMKYAGADRGN